LAVQKVVDLASRQTNQKQIYHFVYSARHFPGCAGVRFSRGQEPYTYSSEAAARGKPANESKKLIEKHISFVFVREKLKDSYFSTENARFGGSTSKTSSSSK